MIKVDSFENKRIKRLKGLNRKKVRVKENLFLIEGRIMLDEAIEEGCNIKAIYVSTSFVENNQSYIKKLEDKDMSLVQVKDSLFNSISDTTTPQGIMAEVEMLEWNYNDIDYPVVILDGVSDPGNVGTIIRTAEAFGFSAVLALKGTADIYNPKTVRSTMGSIYRVPYFTVSKEDVIKLDLEIYGMNLEGEILKSNENLKKKCAVVIGNEANGISDEVLEICKRFIRIPMKGRNESLNAAIAAAIIMYNISQL